jgi:hypothetical protein
MHGLLAILPFVAFPIVAVLWWRRYSAAVTGELEAKDFFRRWWMSLLILILLLIVIALQGSHKVPAGSN